MSDSILDSIKKVLGLDVDYTHFDIDIILHINSALATLTQLGVGPENGFQIEDNGALWSDFVDDPSLNSVKTYIYTKVRNLFDPPATSYGIKALEEVAKELEWRLNVRSENNEEV